MNLSSSSVLGHRIVPLEMRLIPAFHGLLHSIIEEVHVDNSWARLEVKKANSVEVLEQAARDPQAYCPLILDENDKPLGLGVCRHLGGLAKIEWICVGKDSRGRGLGSKLLRRMIAFCEENGCHRIELTTYLGKDHLRRFYETEGFRVMAALPNHRYGIDIWYMIKDLGLTSHINHGKFFEVGMLGSGG